MDNKFLDAFLMSLLAFGALLTVAGIVGASVTIMNKAMLFKEKHSGFKLRSRTRRIKKDDKTRVVLAAAVAAYMKAEEENRSR